MEKQRWEESRRRRKEVRRSEKRKREKKEDAGARKGKKVAIHCVFPMIWGSGGSKSNLAKAAGAEPAGQMREEKLHAVVARSTFPSQNAQGTPFSDHFRKWRCRKSVHRCGAKHISKSTCTKHSNVGPLLEVERSKKCTWLIVVVARRTFSSQNVQNTATSDHFWKLRGRKNARGWSWLWREELFQVKMYKTQQRRTTFGSWEVEKGYAIVARSTFPSQACKTLWSSDHFWRFSWRFPWQAQGILHLVKSEQNVRFFLVAVSTTATSTILYTTLRYITLHYATLNYILLHYTTLHYTPLHNTLLHYITIHSTTLHPTTLHYSALPTLHYTTLHDTTLH